MFDIGWPELLVIAVVALVVIGPKDLPRVLFTVGKWVRKARALAGDFQSGLDDMVREAELDDLKKKAVAARDFSIQRELEKTVDPTGTLRSAFEAPAVDLSATGAQGTRGSPPEEVEGDEATVELPVRPHTPPSAAKPYQPPPPGGDTVVMAADPPVSATADPPASDERAPATAPVVAAEKRV